MNLFCQDASKLNIFNEFFDLTFESTLFLQLTCKDLSLRIANEIYLITKKNGHLIIFDWRYGKLNSEKFSASNKDRIKDILKLIKLLK